LPFLQLFFQVAIGPGAKIENVRLKVIEKVIEKEIERPMKDRKSSS